MTLPNGIDREVGHDHSSLSYGVLYGSWTDETDNPPELRWPTSTVTYERMRRDAKVQEVLAALTLPVRSAAWAVDPNGASPDVVQLVAEDVGLPILGQPAAEPTGRTRGRFSWEEHLRLALLQLTFGHMPFEQVYRIEGTGAAARARLRKLAPRLPRSIETIEVAKDGGLVGIRQTSDKVGQKAPLIGVDRLVWYAHDREGGQWQGQSVLRAAFRPWRLKDEALRVWATSLRRNGIGQPVYTNPPGATQQQIREGRELARRARAGEATGVSLPDGASLTFEGVRGTLPDHEAFVRLQNEEIASAVLAEFLKIGSTANGSRAAADTFVDFFTLSLQAHAAQIAGVATAHIVEDLVDLNFGEDVQAPRVVAERVGTDQRLTAEALSALITAGALVPDDALEAYLRDSRGLPARTTPRPVPTATPAEEPASTAGTGVAAGARAGRGSQKVAAAEREPVPGEEHVDFDRLDAEWRAALDALLVNVQAARGPQLDALLDELVTLLEAGDVAALGALTATPAGGDDILDALEGLARLAALEAVTEAARQGVAVPLPDLDLDELTARASAIEALLARSLGDVAARQALLRFTAGLDPLQVAEQVREHIEGLTDTYLRDVLGGGLTAAQNAGRLAVMDAGPTRDIYASELLDGDTCVRCSGVDGRRYADTLAAAADYPAGGYRDCLGGPRCRGTLVAVYETESEATVQ